MKSSETKARTGERGYVGVDYLRKAAELLEKDKRRSYELMQIQPGDRVLDVGCGPGTDTLPLAQRVSPSGQVHGVDIDPDMIQVARRRIIEAGLEQFVYHHHAEAYPLPFSDNHFDSCRSERVFQHLISPESALAEMARVTKPGGSVVVFDADHGTWSTDTPETDIERRLTAFFADSQQRNGYVGRQLYGLFQNCRLNAIEMEMIPSMHTNYAEYREVFCLDKVEKEAIEAGVVSEQEIVRWRRSLEDADRKRCFFSSASLVMVSGRKPPQLTAA